MISLQPGRVALQPPTAHKSSAGQEKISRVLGMKEKSVLCLLGDEHVRRGKRGRKKKMTRKKCRCW